MQVKVVGHDRGAEDADGDIEHGGVFDDFKLRHEAAEHFHEVRPRENDFQKETAADYNNQRNDQRFDVTKAFVLEIHHGQHVQRGDADAPNQRNFEEQIQRD